MQLSQEIVIVANLLAEQRVIEQLERAGATKPATASHLVDLDRASASSLDALLRAKAIRQVGERYYLDRAAYRALRPNRTVRKRVLLAILLLAAVAVIAAGVVVTLQG